MEMHIQYRIMGDSASKSDTDGNDMVETALSHFGYNCYGYRKPGHWKASCSLKKETVLGILRTTIMTGDLKTESRSSVGTVTIVVKWAIRKQTVVRSIPRKSAKHQNSGESLETKVDVLMANIAQVPEEIKTQEESELFVDLLGMN